jgi:hypothetical protein
MSTIIRWIFNVTLFLLVIYLLVLAFKAVRNQGLGGIFDPIENFFTGLFSGLGMDTAVGVSDNFFADLFVPKQVPAPLVVVPSEAWYENMDTIYRQIYLNNLSYAGMNTDGSFNYDAYFRQYQTPTNIATQFASSSNLQLLFPTPSTYMQLRNYIKDFQ